MVVFQKTANPAGQGNPPAFAKLSALLPGFLFMVLVLTCCASGQADKHRTDMQAVRQHADKAMDELDRNTAAGPASTGQPSGPHQPEGASLRLDDFPVSRYLAAIGSGPDRRQAAADARVEIAKIFKSDIRSSSSFYEDYSSDSASAGRPRQQQHISSATKISTEAVISGIRIVRVARHGKEFLALAVLDREKTWAKLQKQIGRHDRLLAESMNQYRRQSDGLLKVKILKNALRQYELRQNIENQMLVLEPGRPVAPSPVSRQSIETELARLLLHDLRLAVSVTGDGAGQVRRFLTEALTGHGLTVVSRAGEAQILVKGRISLTPSRESAANAKWRWIDWTASFCLVDQKTGSVLASRSDSGRKGHLSFSRARSQALYDINNRIIPRVVEDMTRHLFRLAGQP